jgi:hypothetical protein
MAVIVQQADPLRDGAAQRGATGQRRPLTGGVALDGPVDRRASNAEQVAELRDAVLAGAM